MSTTGPVVAIAFAATLGAQSPQPALLEPLHCDFAITSAPPQNVRVTAFDEIARLLRFRPTDGEPVVFTAMDFSRQRLALRIDGGLRIRWSGDYELEVMNVTDRLVTRISTVLHLGWDNDEGAGRAGHLFTPLAPGQRATITVPDRPLESGPHSRTDGFFLQPSLLSVDFENCRYKPSRR